MTCHHFCEPLAWPCWLRAVAAATPAVPEPVRAGFDAITTTPVMLEQNPTASHGELDWFDQDPYQVAVTAWMRVHLMGDTGLRSMFYGTTCQLCQNAQLKVQRKNMSQ